jgi:hypothetical protein
VFGLVFCYWAYQRAYWRFITYDGLTPEGRLQRWRVDRLAIEMIIIIVLAVIAVIVAEVLLESVAYRLRFSLWSGLFVIVCSVVGFYLLIRRYSSLRAKIILMRDPDFQSNRELRRMSRDLWLHTVFWIVIALGLTAATLAGQAAAYNWFITLLKTKLVV